MIESLLQEDATICHEMISHIALFSHRNPQHIVILEDADQGMLTEVLKHSTVKQVWHSATTCTDARVTPLDEATLSSFVPHTLDIVLLGSAVSSATLAHFFQCLQPEGILAQRCASPFALEPLKSCQQAIFAAGFQDVQALQFPQPNFPSGWRAIIVAMKQGNIKRPREKDIFNKTFSTHYYNLDVHKTAFALPEFLRKELT